MRIADEDILGAVQKRVTIGRGLGGVARQIAAGAGLVLDHDRLAETRRQSLHIILAMMSTAPPGGNPTTRRIGRLG